MKKWVPLKCENKNQREHIMNFVKIVSQKAMLKIFD
jgi:hypothetical protein